MATDGIAQRLQDEDTFDDETFTGLDLQGLALVGKELYGCTFVNCHLQESTWKRTKLEACVFRGCDLTRASFPEAGLRDVRFESSKLMGIDWSSVTANPEMSFEDCNLRYAAFVELNLRETKFIKCSAREVNFFDVDLSDADFTGTDLGQSNFRGCTLTRTDFRGAAGLFLEASRNRVQDTGVSLDTAVLLAQSLGMRVAGYESDLPPAKKTSRPRRR